MLADELDYVVGVDTHRDQHLIAVVAAPTGALIAGGGVARTRRATGSARVAGSTRRPPGLGGRGPGSYGAGLARFLAERGERCSRSAARPVRAAPARQGRRPRRGRARARRLPPTALATADR